jgi:hypothetical protein
MTALVSVLVTLAGVVPVPSAMHAALLHMRGDSSQAQTELEAVLVSTPDEPAALFTAACFAIELGDAKAATAYATRLERVSPQSRHAKVLDALIARRLRLPNERLDDALVEAWRASGRPDLSSKPVLAPIEEWWLDLLPDLEQGVLARLTPPERLMFDSLGGALTHPDFYENVIAAARTANGNPLVVNIEILASLSPSRFGPPIPEAVRREARYAIAQVAPRVTAADPGNGYLSLAAWMPSAGTDIPLGVDDLDLIEQAVAQPRFEIPRREMLREAQAMASRLDPRYAPIRGMMAATVGMGSASLVVTWLIERALATTEPDLRRRTSMVLVKAAKRLEDSGTMLDRMCSLLLLNASAKLHEDEASATAVRAQVDRERRRLDGLREGVKHLGTWPFAGHFHEWDPDGEMARLQRLAR